jgi:hypothetical protein
VTQDRPQCLTLALSGNYTLTRLNTTGLAVLPTWLAVKSHVPVDHQDQPKENMDEEQGYTKEQSHDGTDKGLIVIGESTVAK